MGQAARHGDFAGRRFDGTRFVEEWDRWLQSCFGSLREHESNWVEHYLASPVWLFALGVTSPSTPTGLASSCLRSIPWGAISRSRWPAS
ncbi:type VI secretion system-associated protein TagF [Diaphorobacter aerolatus]|uniref:type VI secretion system-associated protein TagF n=1 Tax=Diaphorobacter aerolatus TaxID=1288495 RepID=UPI00384E80DC